ADECPLIVRASALGAGRRTLERGRERACVPGGARSSELGYPSPDESFRTRTAQARWGKRSRPAVQRQPAVFIGVVIALALIGCAPASSQDQSREQLAALRNNQSTPGRRLVLAHRYEHAALAPKILAPNG